MYLLGQYHAVTVLAIALILSSERFLIPGFLLSAIGKPILAPSALVLAVQKHWKLLAQIAALVAVCYLPFLFFHYSPESGLTFGFNESSLRFFSPTSPIRIKAAGEFAGKIL
jgi:hypothetical protein